MTDMRQTRMAQVLAVGAVGGLLASLVLSLAISGVPSGHFLIDLVLGVKKSPFDRAILDSVGAHWPALSLGCLIGLVLLLRALFTRRGIPTHSDSAGWWYWVVLLWGIQGTGWQLEVMRTWSGGPAPAWSVVLDGMAQHLVALVLLMCVWLVTVAFRAATGRGVWGEIRRLGFAPAVVGFLLVNWLWLALAYGICPR